MSDQRWKSPTTATGKPRSYRQAVTCRLGAYRWHCSLVHQDGGLSTCGGGPATSREDAAALIAEHVGVHGGNR